jgi:hypothetical protein
MSMWGLGKLCGISSLVTSVRFHGPVWCQISRIGVASWERPYLASIVRATSWGLLFQPAIICSTLTLYNRVFLLRFQEKIVDPHIWSDKRTKRRLRHIA